MFDLTSEFGDIYEGHIVRMNNERLVLLLASAHHSSIKLTRFADLNETTPDPAHIDARTDPVSIHLCLWQPTDTITLTLAINDRGMDRQARA